MIAIIPARGGSKGLPGKNIRPLCGKPLIAYTIDCARQAKSIERVIVSTDDREIAEIARQYGAEVPFLRPDHLASDSAQAVDAYIYTISRLSQEEGVAISEFVVLLPTCPLRLPSDIDGAVALFRKKQADSVVSYTPEAHPVRWHRFLTEDGSFEDIFPPTLANRQEERMSYYPNGAIYVFRSEIIRQRRYYTNKSYAYVMPRSRSVDIDSLEDFAYAEFLMGRSLTIPAGAERAVMV